MAETILDVGETYFTFDQGTPLMIKGTKEPDFIVLKGPIARHVHNAMAEGRTIKVNDEEFRLTGAATRDVFGEEVTDFFVEPVSQKKPAG